MVESKHKSNFDQILTIIIGLLVLVLLVGCEPSKKSKYREYYVDAIKRLAALQEFRSEFQKCYGSPTHYDPIFKHYNYTELTFFHADYLGHFSVTIPELIKELDFFVKRYESKPDEKYFWSFHHFRESRDALQKAHDELDKERSKIFHGEFTFFPYRMGDVMYHIGRLESHEDWWLQGKEVLEKMPPTWYWD